MNNIPKKIHYCWLSGDPFPDLINRCIQSWQTFLPDYEFVLWDKERFDLDSNVWVKQAYDHKKYAFAADYIRLYSLYHHGGIYLDTDVEVLKSFNDFLHHSAFTGFESRTDIEAAVIGSVKGHPWIKDILDYYKDKSFINPDGSVNNKILPVIMSYISRQQYNFNPNGQYQVLKSDVHVYPEDFFSPRDIRTLKINTTSNSVAIHHFNAGWIKKGATYKLKRLGHLILRLMGEKAHTRIILFIRRFTGNSKI